MDERRRIRTEVSGSKGSSWQRIPSGANGGCRRHFGFWPCRWTGSCARTLSHFMNDTPHACGGSPCMQGHGVCWEVRRQFIEMLGIVFGVSGGAAGGAASREQGVPPHAVGPLADWAGVLHCVPDLDGVAGLTSLDASAGLLRMSYHLPQRCCRGVRGLSLIHI